MAQRVLSARYAQTLGTSLEPLRPAPPTRIEGLGFRGLGFIGLPMGPKVVLFWGSYSEFYKVIPKRNYFGVYGYAQTLQNSGL